MFDRISGFFFLLIIVLLILADILYGYKTFGDDDLDKKLDNINRDMTGFKRGVLLVLIEHFTIISLAITLFIAFSPYNIILGVIWLISRITEALIQIYDKRNYWNLINIATKSKDASVTEKDALFSKGNKILETRAERFSIAQILFSIGTFAYSVMFVIYEVVPVLIGWFGIMSSCIYCVGNLQSRRFPEKAGLWGLGGLLILIYEFILGGWLLIFGGI